MESVFKIIDSHQIRYRLDCTLAELSTFKIGGPINCVFFPETIEQCSVLIRLAKEHQRKLIYLGNGSNILGSDKGCDEWVLKTDFLNQLEADSDGILTIGAGVKCVKASSFAAKNGLCGLEFAHGIPGSLGGAIFMNAGAYGGSMDQIVVSTDYLDANGELQTLDSAHHEFGYRKSFFMNHPEFLIVQTKLKLGFGSKQDILAVINDLQQKRRDKQPLEYPSAGSTFKRPEGYFAGKLIEDAGLKGFCIGGAQVSEKHAGFIINANHASSDDVKKLIAHVQKTVKQLFGVDLDCEVRFVGKE